MPKIPLDQQLVDRGLCANLDEARRLARAGRVRVNDQPAPGPGARLSTDARIAVVGEDRPFAGRGGLKLQGALNAFGVDVNGMRCLDVGASTGGFTDCLLKSGARSVCALDVGYGLLDARLRGDPRVAVVERTNIRNAAPGDLPGPFDLATVDVSFISLDKVFPALKPLLSEGGRLLALVKPQFEAPPEDVGKGGIVSDPAVWREALQKAVRALRENGFVPLGAAASPVRGAKGNREFFLYAAAETGIDLNGPDGEALERQIEAALSSEAGR